MPEREPQGKLVASTGGQPTRTQLQRIRKVGGAPWGKSIARYARSHDDTGTWLRVGEGVMDIQPAPGPVGRVTVAPSGHIDLANAPQLADALAQAQGSGAAEIVVDLSAVEFLDTAGVGVLAQVAHHATQTGANVYLHGARGWVAQVLEITGIAAYLPPPPDRPTEQ